MIKRIGIYPGSFNPWHEGHNDILKKSLEVFDKVYVCVMHNPDKEDSRFGAFSTVMAKIGHRRDTIVIISERNLKDIVKDIIDEEEKEPLPCKFAIIRGLRNGNDLQYEMNNQYWNEDTGLYTPFVYFITDRKLAHVSSSAIRTIKKLGLINDY
jgi:pantetheine-phosphate adenylyltransferase